METLNILPVDDNSVDVIISNCAAFNLSPNKQAVFQEAFRVSKSGKLRSRIS